LNQNSSNPKLKKLIRQLGEAIHETVSESEDIAGVVKHIREEGFDVLLMLEATIGLNELEEAEKSAPATPLVHGEAVTFNANDLSFLRSLRITLTEEKAEADGAENGSHAEETPPGA
jgi:hypothetical protein